MEKQTNIPALRFPEFKGEWEKKTLGHIYSFKVTNSFSRDNLNYENGIVKNIHYGDIHTKFQTLFDITKEKVPFVNSDISIARISEENYCKEGDLILADASEDLNDVGKSIELVNLNNEKLLSGLHTILARPNLEKFDIGFGGYLFKSNKVRSKIQKEAQGSKVLSISATRLSNLILEFPSKAEQTKIANFLTAVDEKLQALKKKKNLLETYKKGVMQKIFSQALRFKEDNGKEFPKWEKKRLKEVADKITDGTHDTPIPVSNGIPYLTAIHIKDGNIDYENCFFLAKEDHDKIYKRCNPEKGDLLIVNIGAGTGTSALNNMDYEFSLKNVALVKPNKNMVNSFFLEQIIRRDTKKMFTQLASGGAQPFLSLNEIGKIKLSVPILVEQKKIANFLSTIDNKINQTETQIQQTQLYKKGLLQNMFV